MKKIFRNTALLALAAVAWTRGLPAQETPKTSQKPSPASLGQELFRFGTQGIGPSQMTYVQSVAVDPEGFIYTADWDLDRVQRFSPTGKLDSLVYIGGLGPNAYDRAGFLWVAAGGALIRYDPSTWTAAGGLANLGDGSIAGLAPRAKSGVVVLLDNRLTDTIVVIDNDGRVARAINEPLKTQRSSTFSNPCLAVGLEDEIYIGDNHSRVIYKFSPDGRFISHFSSEGKGPGQFVTSFEGMTVDGHGRLWVSDWDGLNVFAPDGRFLQRFNDVDGEGLAAGGDEIYATDDDQVIKYAAGLPGAPIVPRQARAAREESGLGSWQTAGLVAVDRQGFSLHRRPVRRPRPALRPLGRARRLLRHRETPPSLDRPGCRPRRHRVRGRGWPPLPVRQGRQADGRGPAS